MLIKKWVTVLFGFGFLASTSVLAQNETKNIFISESAPYLDETLVQANVLKECTDLGSTFSHSLAEGLTASGFQVEKSAQLDPSKGYAVEAQLVTMTSGGSFMFGKQTGGSVKVTLRQDGKLVANKSFTRTSGGGVFGAYRGACNILGKVSSVLGEDVAKWVVEQPRP